MTRQSQALANRFPEYFSIRFKPSKWASAPWFEGELPMTLDAAIDEVRGHEDELLDVVHITDGHSMDVTDLVLGALEKPLTQDEHDANRADAWLERQRDEVMV